MSENFVDRIYSHKAPCYSNALHHVDLEQSYGDAYERMSSEFTRELIAQQYISECCQRFDSAPVAKTVSKTAAGTRLLKLVKSRVTQSLKVA